MGGSCYVIDYVVCRREAPLLSEEEGAEAEGFLLYPCGRMHACICSAGNLMRYHRRV